jgi:N-acetylglucosamine kinase
MEYYIGLDGGGSKTKCVLTDSSLNILSEFTGGPSNFITIGTDIVTDTILDLIQKCCNEKNISHSEIKGIILGTTGAGREQHAKKLENAVLQKATKLNITINSFKVESDARISLEGAFSGSPGSILIAGTGSIMFGKCRDGLIYRVGGFGRLIGDEGSGLTLGRKGLNIISKSFDGRGKETILSKKMKEQFRINNQEELITEVYSNEFKIQLVAPLVIESANEGDELCTQILDEETDELVMHVAAMNRKLNEENMKLVFIGGTITSDNYYSKMLREKINLFLPNIKIQQPDFPPEIGAVIMAK